MSFIAPATDVSDFDVLQFIAATDARLSTWLSSVDNEINSIAYEHGLDEGAISTPLNDIVKEYAVAYYCYIVFRDNVGAVNPDLPDTEKYLKKFEIYAQECARLRKRISKEMLFFGDDDDAIDPVTRAPVNMLFRG